MKIMHRYKVAWRMISCWHRCKLHFRTFCYSLARQSHCEHNKNVSDFRLDQPELDMHFLCDSQNQALITENNHCRRGTGDYKKLLDLWEQLKKCDAEGSPPEAASIGQLLKEEALKFPNTTHPTVLKYDKNKILEVCGEKSNFGFPPAELYDVASKLGLLRTAHLGNLTGRKTYYLTGALASLEQALIRYTVEYLLKRNFTLVSVPDLLHPELIEGCGMPTRGKRTQVYSLDLPHGSFCLSGTAEMALAGLFCNQILSATSLPQRLAAVSRCYRAEVTSTAEERGIFRVHQFTKVEMFAVTKQNDNASNIMLDEFVSIQRDLFAKLGLHFQVVDMAPAELGNPAYRKIDIEAWMPGRKTFGEISSASNCTDYQSRRLGIKYEIPAGELRHVHTVNGTACAIPRMLIALVETNQQGDGSITVPGELQRYMNNVKVIKDKLKPNVKWVTFKSKS